MVKDCPVGGAIASGGGYLGGKMFQGPLEKMFNPISKQYEWVPIGKCTITNPAPQSSIPAIIGGAADSAIGKQIDHFMVSKWDEEK